MIEMPTSARAAKRAGAEAPATGRRAALEAALGRYRPLFDDAAAHWDGFIDAVLRPLPACVWANPARIDGAGLAGLLAEDDGIAAQPLAWVAGFWSRAAAALAGEDRAAPVSAALRLPPGFRAGQRWWYCAGLAHAQEEVSQLPVLLLDPAPGQRVLDLCAAPGGKTAQIAYALGNRGTLVANDCAADRIAALQGNLDRLGIVNTSTTLGDGGNYPAAAGGFERILVDAPCSSEGTLRRNASLAERGPGGLGPERSARMAGRQRALLRKAAQLCRPGGRIVYSTCTFAPEENELVVAEVLDQQRGDLSLAEVAVPGLTTGPGLCRWQGRRLDPQLGRCLRVWPHDNDTGGFFVAVLEKSASAPSPSPGDAADASAAAEDAHWLPALGAHYGIAPEHWARYRWHRQTRRGLHLAAADHRPPATPAAQGSGLFLHRTNIRPPKLTTGGALLLGGAATRSRIDLTAAQRDAYLRRQGFTPAPAQTRDCRPGQVLVRWRGFTLGVALLHRSGELESLFPRRWSGCTAGH